MKWALLCAKTSKAGKQLDTKQISDTVLRNRMEHLIERIFGAYPEDYGFGYKELQYDSVANTVNHIGAFVDIFRVLNLNKAVKTILLFPMRMSIAPGFTMLNKTIIAWCILSITKSRLKALHKDNICLGIEIPEIPHLKDPKGKSPE
ncbi:hypothetical protein GGF37_002526 [Kickxella alabastrina]|nr:hypothetical protein GGF37_002526 [Kickxella alabastrina]